MKLKLLCIILACLCAVPHSPVWGNDIVVSGTVKNKSNHKKMGGVSILVPGTNIGTVSNADGTFTIKIADSIATNGLKAEHLGFHSFNVPASSLRSAKDIVILMEPSAITLREITVYSADPRLLMEKALEKIPENYSQRKNMFSAFYRETIRKGSRYISVSEAIVSVLKTPYRIRRIGPERVRVDKGRRLVSQRKSDTLSVKVTGGPMVPLLFDIVKNENMLFTASELDYYSFRMEPGTSIDDRPQFVVSFRPVVKTEYPLYKGTVYIDCETCAFTRVEFSMDMSDKEKVVRSILRKKPRGLRFKPRDVDFTVAYKYQDGVSYLNYISARVRFNCDWKRRLFSAGYTAYNELVMVDRDDAPETEIPRRNAVRPDDIFYDMVDDFTDPDFWKDYNIIEPTESLEKAIRKLKKNH